jgi:integrase
LRIAGRSSGSTPGPPRCEHLNNHRREFRLPPHSSRECRQITDEFSRPFPQTHADFPVAHHTLETPHTLVPRCLQLRHKTEALLDITIEARAAVPPDLTQLRVKTRKRLVVPLTVDAVARFWSSFRTSRDLAIVGLMLLHGLRSCEVLALNRDDVNVADSQIQVLGKGKKIRVLPLTPESLDLLDHYLQLERPSNCSPALFVSLKGRARGNRMTAAGLRSLFRYHRRTTGVAQANPHRFRHTFASDMIRAGISLPALMQLMGHAQIQTTLVYVQITPREVWEQYARAVAQHLRPGPPSQP